MKKWIAGLLLAGTLLAGCGEQPEGDVYTNKDIYLESFECGYISEYQNIRYATVIIENEEQLAYAEEQYGLNEKETYQDNWMHYPTGFSRYFTIMKEEYPLEKYNYVFSYDEVSSGGYYYHADRLEITENSIYFLMDDESYSPKDFEAVSAVMGGFGHVAAVPKEYMEGREFFNGIYPDISVMYEDNDYRKGVFYDIAGEELYEVYGNAKYLIRTQEEYEAYLAMSEEVMFDESSKMQDTIDFEKTALLVIFFTRDESRILYKAKDVEIKDKRLIWEYELVQKEPAEKMEPKTGRLYAHVPQRFLTEESYEGWTVPEVDEVYYEAPIDENTANTREGSSQETTAEVPQEVKDIMVAFYTAYFDAEGEADKLQPYLSETFAYEVELYHDIEPNSTIYSADNLDVRVIKTQSGDIRGAVGDECILSLEFRFPDEDSLTYLTTNFVRESSGWKITSYGLEK